MKNKALCSIYLPNQENKGIFKVVKHFLKDFDLTMLVKCKLTNFAFIFLCFKGLIQKFLVLSYTDLLRALFLPNQQILLFYNIVIRLRNIFLLN